MAPRKKIRFAPLSWLKGRPRLAWGLVLMVVAAGFLLAGLALGTWQNVCRDCPSVAEIYVWEPKQSTKILSHDGRLIKEIFQERRTPVSLDSLPDYVPEAFVAVEDKRFYEHGGLDAGDGARRRNLVLGRWNAGGGQHDHPAARPQHVQRQIGFVQRIGGS